MFFNFINRLKLQSFFKILICLCFINFSFPLEIFAGNKVKVKGKKLKTSNASEGQIIQAKTESGKFKARWINATDAIDDSSITGDKIVGDAITGGKIEDGAISSNKIIAGAVTESKIATDAVTTAKIADGVMPATYVVDANGGGNYTNITNAINALPTSGGKIFIKEGTYAAATTIYNRDDVSLEGSGPATVLTNTLLINYADNIIVENLTVSKNTAEAIDIKQCNNIQVLNCTITSRPLTGIAISDSLNVLLKNNTIYPYTYGVDMSGTSQNVRIDNNSIYTNTGWGIYIQGTCAYLNVSNNFLDMTDSASIHGIKFEGTATSSFGIIANNIIKGGDVGIESSANYLIISNNIIFGNNQFAIVLSGDAYRTAVNFNVAGGEIQSKRSSNADHIFYGNIVDTTITTAVGDNSSQPMSNVSGLLDNPNEHNIIF